MRAAVYRRHGPPEVVRIENVPVPVPKSTEVLVRVRAATVSAADWRLRSAAPFPIRIFNGLWRPTKINILGMEFSGVVESVGNVVTRFAPRLRVDRSPARHEILDQLAGLGLLQFSSDAHGMALQ